MSAPLRFKALASITDVPQAAWDALVPPGAPPVLRWAWLAALEESGCAVAERGWEAQHLVAYRGDALVGAAPAWRKHHSLGEYVYDFSWAHAAEQLGVRYYPKFLVGVPLSPLTTPRFLLAAGEGPALRAQLFDFGAALAKESGCSSVHVIFPPEEEALALEAHGALSHRASLQYHWRNEGYRTYDDFLARFDAKRRHQLKRERAEAGKQGLTVRTVRSHELEPQHAELAWRFYQATATRHAWGPVQLNRDFFRRAFAALAPQIELVVAERGREVIAGAFNLHTPTRLYGRYWGAFQDVPFLHFHVCLYHSVDDCIARGLEAFEPGAGGEHKIARGFQPTRIHSVHRVFEPRLDRAVRGFCQREAEQILAVVADSERAVGFKVRPAAAGVAAAGDDEES